MTDHSARISLSAYARIAGILYLAIFCLGIFGELVVRQSLIVPGDAVATINNILDAEALFRLSVLSDLLRQTLLVLLPLVLYGLFKTVNRSIALIMMIFGLVGVPIEMLNTLNYFAVLRLLSGADYLTALGTDQLHAQAMFFLDLHNYGAYISQFLGLWLFPLGYLAFKSGFLPRIFGLWIMVGGLCYLIDVVIFILFPGSNISLSVIAFLGELVFAFWLLIKGIHLKEQRGHPSGII